MTLDPVAGSIVGLNTRDVTLLTSPASQLWLKYLGSLRERNINTESVITAAECLWLEIERAVPDAMPPNTRPTDEGELRMSWNRRGAYLEILIAPNATFGWFYTDTVSNASEDEEGLRADSSLANLFARISGLF